jgi:nucleoside 2-deoxyribosyltransferase
VPRGKPRREGPRPIDSSDAVVALIYDDSVAAPCVHLEIGYALKAGEPMIPLVPLGIASDSA